MERVLVVLVGGAVAYVLVLAAAAAVFFSPLLLVLGVAAYFLRRRRREAAEQVHRKAIELEEAYRGNWRDVTEIPRGPFTVTLTGFDDAKAVVDVSDFLPDVGIPAGVAGRHQAFR